MGRLRTCQLLAAMNLHMLRVLEQIRAGRVKLEEVLPAAEERIG